nr:hypothetical protein [Tanacetum cinerariifolium]
MTTGVAPEAGLAKEIAAMGPHMIKERRKRSNDREDTNAPPKVLKRDHADSRLTESTIGGKSLAAMGLGMGSTFPAPTLQDTLIDVSDPDPLSFANPQSIPTKNVAQSSKGAAVAGDPKSENTSFTSMVESSESIYQSEWGVTNGCHLDALEACQDPMDHIAPQGYFSELRHLHNDDFLKQYNINLARQVAMGSQLRLRFEQEAKLLKKSVAQVAHLQLINDRLSQQVSTLQAQVTGEEKLKAAFEEFKQYEDDRVEKRCVEMDARRRWVIGHVLCLMVMKCGESTELRQVFTDIVLAGIAKGMSEGLNMRDLKYPVVDQLESLKDAPIDVIMASLHLESDTEDDAPQWIRELRPSSFQLKIHVYPEVRDPKDPWAFKEEILLADAIAANISRTEKKKKCLNILLANAATQTETSEDEASSRICTGSVSCAPWESSRMHLTS